MSGILLRRANSNIPNQLCIHFGHNTACGVCCPCILTEWTCDLLSPKNWSFLEVLEQKHLPSGFSLLPGQQRVGRPNNHWLSRLPAKAKRWKFRQQLCDFLRNNPQALQFRNFYAANVVQTEFEGVYRSLHGAAGIRGAD